MADAPTQAANDAAKNLAQSAPAKPSEPASQDGSAAPVELAQPVESADLEALARELTLTEEGLALLGAAAEAPTPTHAQPQAQAQTTEPPAQPPAATTQKQGPRPQSPGQADEAGRPHKSAHKLPALTLLRPRVLALLTAGSLLAGAVVLTNRPQKTAPKPTDTVAPAAKPAALAAAERGPAPAPAVRPSTQTKAAVWPAPILVPLTAARVQQLDCPSLQAGLQREAVAPGLATWARFRLAWACGDFRARTAALPPAPPSRRHVSADDMLAFAGRAGLAHLQESELTAARYRPGSWQRTPQGRLIVALYSKHGSAAERKEALSKLAQARSLDSDGQILLANLQQASAPALAEHTLQELVAHGDPLALARASRALFEMASWQPLLLGLDARADALTARALPGLLVQTSALHRPWLVAMALRAQLAVGNLAEAFELARLQEELSPNAVSAQQAAALAGLLGVKNAGPSAKSAAGAASLAARPQGQAMADATAAQQASTEWTSALSASTVALQQALKAAQKQQDSAAETSLAAALFWHDPLAQDPVPLALAWFAGQIRRSNDAAARAPFVGFLQRWAQARPQDDRPLAELASAAESCHDTALLIAALQSLLLRHPQDEALSLRLAQALLDAGDSARAQPLLTALNATISAANKPKLLYVQARAVAAHDPLQARVFLAAANKLQPDARNDIFLSELFEAHGQVEEAASALGRASAARPTDVALAVRQADLLLRAGNGQQARTLMQRWIAAQEGCLTARYKLYEIEHKLGNLPAAAENLAAAANLPGAPAELWVQLGRLQLLEMGQLNQGISTLRQALLKAPQAAEGHYLLGLGLRDVGDERGMRESWQRYLLLAPRGPFAAEVHQGLRR